MDKPELRIVSDELWERAKQRQAESREEFDRHSTNRLNATHRPEYLLSRMLQCAECGGPYAISGKDRYSGTNARSACRLMSLTVNAAPTVRRSPAMNWKSASSTASGRVLLDRDLRPDFAEDDRP